MRLLFLLLVSVVFVSVAFGQCWGSGRGAVAPVYYSAPYYYWEYAEGAPNEIHLMYGSRQMGTVWEDGLYYRFSNKNWSDSPSTIPSGAPSLPGAFLRRLEKLKQQEPTTNHGLDWKPSASAPEKFIFMDREISRKDGLDILQNGVPDDRHKLFFTVIGRDKGLRKKVVNDVQALLDVKDQLLIQDYDPDNFAVKDAGFVTVGNPTIYLQAPAGKNFWLADQGGQWHRITTQAGDVLHRQDTYESTRLASAVRSAIRRTNPDYRPENDPDLSIPPPKPKPLDPVKPVDPVNPTPTPAPVLPANWAWLKEWANWLVVAGVWLLTWFVTKRPPEGV